MLLIWVLLFLILKSGYRINDLIVSFVNYQRINKYFEN